MYCIKCGVELAGGQSVCPVCQTKVYHPDLPVEDALPTYPQKEFQSEEFNPRGVLFVITILAALVIGLVVGFELSLHHAVGWSGYVAGGILLAYLVVILPGWFKHPNPVIFVPCDFAAIALLLFYINLRVEGDWYFKFALPVTVGAAVICCSVSILTYYLKRGRLYIAGGAIIATGAYSIFIEMCLHAAFAIHDKLVWSLYPATAFALIGMMLIVIAIVRPLKEQLYKIFAF